MHENWKILLFVLLTILMVAGIGYFITQDSYRSLESSQETGAEGVTAEDSELSSGDSSDRDEQREEALKLKAQQEVESELESFEEPGKKIDIMVDSLISETVTAEGQDLLEELEEEEEKTLKNAYQEASQSNLDQ
jgi:preprotein translocase subunit SecF